MAFAGNDTTHHSDYGSYELAKCIVEGIKENKLPLAKYLVDTAARSIRRTPTRLTSSTCPPSRKDQRPYGNRDYVAHSLWAALRRLDVRRWTTARTCRTGRAGCAVAADRMPRTRRSTRKLPTVWVIGDSTANNQNHRGWADPFAAYFDPAKVNVVNRARAGRSSRTFLTEGLWDSVLAELKPGDYVLIQFGHNDGGAARQGPRARIAARASARSRRNSPCPTASRKWSTPSAGTCGSSSPRPRRRAPRPSCCR